MIAYLQVIDDVIAVMRYDLKVKFDLDSVDLVDVQHHCLTDSHDDLEDLYPLINENKNTKINEN